MRDCRDSQHFDLLSFYEQADCGVADKVNRSFGEVDDILVSACSITSVAIIAVSPRCSTYPEKVYCPQSSRHRMKTGRCRSGRVTEGVRG